MAFQVSRVVKKSGEIEALIAYFVDDSLSKDLGYEHVPAKCKHPIEYVAGQRSTNKWTR